MDFQSFLVITSQQNFRDNGVTRYKSIVDGIQIFNLGVAIPCIIVGQGCVGVAVPYEMHISENGTIVFYNMLDRSAFDRNTLQAFYKLYTISTSGQKTGGYTQRQDRDTARTGMDAATRMMMGEDRSARDIANGSRSDNRRRGGQSIWDMMRQSNPGDPLFEDDDDDY